MSVEATVGSQSRTTPSAREMRKVIWGSSLGTVFEWYDFFVYGTLAATLGPLFFSKALGETGAFLASLATYGAGLVLRPFGSLLFGRLGDVVGRDTTMVLVGRIGRDRRNFQEREQPLEIRLELGVDPGEDLV